MRWPWVSRESAERLIAYHEQAAGEWKQLCRIEVAKTAALQERLLSLKMTGAVEVPKERERDGLTAPAPKADELRDLIAAKAGTNLRLRGVMLRQLAQDRADGLSAEKIAQRIEQGVESAGVPQ